MQQVRVGENQHIFMIDWMENHKLVARNLIARCGEMGNKFVERKYDELTIKLNEMGPCMKTARQWREYWKNCRLRARARRNRFLRAYNRTGHNDPSLEISAEDERITNIFGVPGLGWAVIPESGFKERKQLPTREQMETLVLFLIQESQFAIDFEDIEKWNYIISLLHSKIGPRFNQAEWKDLYLQDVQKMLQAKGTGGVERLDDYLSLIHHAYSSAEQASAEMGYDDGASEHYFHDDATITISSDEEYEELENDATNSTEQPPPSSYQPNEKIKHEVQAIEPDANVNRKVDGSSSSKQLLDTFRAELKDAINKLDADTDEKLARSRRELDQFIENEVRTMLRKTVASIRSRDEELKTAVTAQLQTAQEEMLTAIRKSKSDCKQCTTKVIGAASGAAAHMALALITEGRHDDDVNQKQNL